MTYDHGNDQLTCRNWPTETRRPGESVRDWIARIETYPLGPEEPLAEVIPLTRRSLVCTCSSPSKGRYGGCGTCHRMILPTGEAS